MKPVPGQPGLFQSGSSGGTVVEVRTRTAGGWEDAGRVELMDADGTVPGRVAKGSDKDSVGAWPDQGILATKLGPNRNGWTW